MTRCRDGCRCGRHAPRTPEHRAKLGAAIHAAAQRRHQHRKDATAKSLIAFGHIIHRPCKRCGRLLPPDDHGRVPEHRTPTPHTYNRTSVPLTGLDAPWCKGKVFA